MSDERIVELYSSGNYSINAIASESGRCAQSVRKVLISAGAYTNDTHAAVCDLHAQGMSADEITLRLGVSKSTVMTYVPYKRGPYKKDSPTENAIRIRAMREKGKKK